MLLQVLLFFSIVNYIYIGFVVYIFFSLYDTIILWIWDEIALLFFFYYYWIKIYIQKVVWNTHDIFSLTQQDRLNTAHINWFGWQLNEALQKKKWFKTLANLRYIWNHKIKPLKFICQLFFFHSLMNNVVDSSMAYTE